MNPAAAATAQQQQQMQRVRLQVLVQGLPSRLGLTAQR
jgi:hypothetical protein